MFFVELASAEPLPPDGVKTRILGGILPLHGETWFFKMTGPDELVASQRATFTEFIKSAHPADPNTAHSHEPAPAAAGASTNAPTPPLLEPVNAPPLRYQLPAAWQEKPLAPMRVASFNATAPNGKQADVSVVSLSGSAGGTLANVNRWREQMKLPPIDESTLQESADRLEAGGHTFLVVDLPSAGPLGEQNEKQRILAAIVEKNDRSWFIKMTGEEAAVASQKSAFADFLRSLQLP